MTEYKDQAKVKFIPTKTIAQNNAREHDLVLTTHTGTHVDAPAHFMEHGASLDDIDLHHFIGSCVVFDLAHVSEKITKSDLIDLSLEPNNIILFKTKNSLLNENAKAPSDFIYLDASAAKFLASKKLNAVGLDYLGIERNQPNHETHKILLAANIMIIEGLRLKNVEPGRYLLFCLPIKLCGLEAAPARAVLIKLN